MKTMKTHFKKLVLSCVLATIAVSAAFSQKIAAKNEECPEEKAKADAIAIAHKANFSATNIPVAAETDSVQVEKAVETDAKPAIAICVMRGSVRIRGWQRNEVRTMIEGGNKIGYKILQKNGDGKPNYLMLVGFDPKNAASRAPKEGCLSGDLIEIEVPYGSSISYESRSGSDLLIEEVGKAKINNTRGTISIREISERAEVSSISGSILAEDVTGEVLLKTFSGDIAAYRLKTASPTDSLKISSSGGNVVLQDCAHSNIEASTNRGDLIAFGKVVSGGRYNYNTTSGSVTLFLPIESSFQLTATFTTEADFQTNFPVKTKTETLPNTNSKRVVGSYKTGDAVINLTTINGLLRLKKK